MKQEDLNHLKNLLDTFLFEYGTDLQESSTYTETDKIFLSDIENKIIKLIK